MFPPRVRAAQRLAGIRPFTTSSPLTKQMGDSSSSHLPDPSQNKAAAPDARMRSDRPNTDHQSSASQDEHKTGDDHPAKQPDDQAEPTRMTGIGGGEEVKGGKEGLGERGDKQ
ncbi:hypothetical protein BDU57DRAFT_513107 [Ampelomyces quisqualis]|uniref:Uncharacterized protein n=1 Tax=Ampelomyces quisqualis TaxID=50730 RepID=A0A6A5QVQ9_AMPQU|nr:hypothetical protein BDU57DRAFT_513107 [Ampelomyces quisqualis]